jgi:uncharacterized protein YdaU (DUF1376 family)
MSLPYFPFYPGDHLRDTLRLSTEAQGAYVLLMLDYWTKGAPPDDDAVLAKITGLSLRRWKKHRPALESYFRIESGQWIHNRIERELAEANNRHRRRVEAGRSRGKAKANGKQSSRLRTHKT